MDQLFRVLGVILGCYVAYGLATGAIYANSGLFARSFRRDEDGLSYWPAIGANSLLSLALLFWF
jgi:hypothetical protein